MARSYSNRHWEQLYVTATNSTKIPEPTRDQILETAPIFPDPGELLVEGLTNTEEDTFLAAIADA